ncbi:hypothetical protein [Dactylosporangium sp. NPDC049140]|uniref:hypothetical protein n=1 Tax=Dactylosporangium sp. NPDC049140 TaxID=3155647 RepID=UPI0033E49A83
MEVEVGADRGGHSSPGTARNAVIRRGVIDALTMVLIGVALVGNYLLRRYARAELLYHRPSERHTPAADRSGPTGFGSAGAVPPPAEQPTFVPDRQAIPAGASVRCQ